MTVSTEVDHNDYTGNGVTTAFPYTFRVFKKSDLVVTVLDLSQNMTTLILDTDYTVSGAGGYTGGNVTLTSPLTSGWQISIARQLPVTQETDLRNQGKFFAEVHEDAFDRLTMLIQQVRGLFSLSLRKPSSIANWYDALNNYIRNLRDPSQPQDAATKNYVDSLASANFNKTLRTPENIPALSSAASRANKVVAFDSLGNPVAIVPVSGSAADVMLQFISTDIDKADALLTVKQPYTGSIAFTQHEFNRRIIHVDDYAGTYGDGVTPDTAGFAAAIAAAKTTGGNSVIFLTPGKTYYLPYGIDIDAVNLVISGYGASIKYGPTNFTYEHCLRIVNTGRVRLEGMRLYCSSSLVRDQTGFGILIANSNKVTLRDIELESIASAGVWVLQSSGVFIHTVNNNNNKADGIHISNGVHDFIIASCHGNGCADDTFAIVNDTPGTGIPYSGVVSGILATNSTGGHGLVMIGCADINVSGFVARGCAAPGIGSYFWNGADPANDENWVRECIFSNVLIDSCGISPVNTANATSWFIGALKNCTISGGRVSGAPGSSALGVPANCIQLANAVNVNFKGMHLHNSNAYGFMTLDSLTTGVSNFTDVIFDGTTFTDIASDVVHIFPTNTIGSIKLLNSTLVNSPFSTTFNRASIIGRTGSNKVVISGNKNTYNSMPFSYDATCLNVEAYSNKPTVLIGYTPIITGLGGTPSGTATGNFYDVDGITYGEVTLNLTAANSATDVIFSLPKSPVSGAPVLCTGRENTRAFKMLQGYLATSNTVRLSNADATGSISGLTMPIVVTANFYYRSA